jgi:phosphate transport system substrate-binding protein
MRALRTRFLALWLTLACLPPLVASGAVAAELELRGAGATFPLPYYQSAFESFTRQSGIAVGYQGVGSGEGIRLLTQRRVDFGGTDAFMAPQELAEAGAPIVHIPTCLGAVAITYYLPGNPRLQMSSDVIADLFLGHIKRWNDPRLVRLNSDRRLPDLPVRVVYRSDSSGTSQILSEYLSKTSPLWRERVGTVRKLHLPGGVGGAGNPGVAGLIRQAPGSFGYVELIYALGNDLLVADVRNRAGRFVSANLESVSLAGRVPLPDDTNASLTDTEAAEGYPISGFTWLALYREQDYDGRPRERAEALARLLAWMIRDGQAQARTLHYAPLPDEATRKAEALLKSLTYRRQPILR